MYVTGLADDEIEETVIATLKITSKQLSLFSYENKSANIKENCVILLYRAIWYSYNKVCDLIKPLKNKVRITVD